MLLTLYDSYGNEKARIEPDDSSTQDKEIQGDNLLKLSFTLYEFVAIDVNDYVDYGGERYWAVEKYVPAQKSTMEWEYSLQLYGMESLIKRFLVLNDTDGESEAVFTLTARPTDHVRLIVRNINDGMDGTTNFKAGAVEGTENVVIDYTGKYCDEALKELAEAVGTEWWFDGETLNLCRCEHGEELTLGYGNGLTSLDRDTADNAKFYTRLFPIGSSRNIDVEKYGASRLQLPGGKKYVDVNVERYGVIHHYEQGAFAGIYPRRVGVVGSVRHEEVKDKDGKPFSIWYFKDNDLPFDPNDYEIGGLVKRVSFQEGSELAGLGTDNEHYFEVNFNSETREFEIITIWPYDDDTQLPGGTLVPKAGDKYILWNIRMPDEYYDLAEEELRGAVDEYNRKHALDVGRYKAPTDHVWMEDTGTELFVGRRIRLESREYFPESGYRQSRITRISRKVSLPGQMDLEISDALSAGAMAKIGDAINDAKNYAGTMVGAINVPDVIRSWESTKASDSNLFSARRTVKEFLSKFEGGVIQGLVTFLKGIAIGAGYSVSEDGVARLAELLTDNAAIDREGNATMISVETDAVSSHHVQEGMDGSGYRMWIDANGVSHLEIDSVEARKKIVAQAIEIKKKTFTSGNLSIGPAGHKVTRVMAMSGQPSYNGGDFGLEGLSIIGMNIFAIPDGSGGYLTVMMESKNTYRVLGTTQGTVASDADITAYKVYFKKSDGELEAEDDMRRGDMVKMQEFSMVTSSGGHAGNRYFWRLCLDHGVERLDDGNLYIYAILSNINAYQTLLDEDGKEIHGWGYDSSVTNDAPVPGDDLVVEGSVNNPDRQNLQVFDSAGEGAPSFTQYADLGKYTDSVSSQYTLADYHYLDSDGAERVQHHVYTALRPSSKGGNVIRAMKILMQVENGETDILTAYRQLSDSVNIELNKKIGAETLELVGIHLGVSEEYPKGYIELNGDTTKVTGDLDLKGRLISNTYVLAEGTFKEGAYDIPFPDDFLGSDNVKAWGTGVVVNGDANSYVFQNGNTRKPGLLILPRYEDSVINGSVEIKGVKQNGLHIVIRNSFNKNFCNWRYMDNSAFTGETLMPGVVVICADPYALDAEYNYLAVNFLTLYTELVNAGNANGAAELRSRYLGYNTNNDGFFVNLGVRGKFIVLMPGQMIELVASVEYDFKHSNVVPVVRWYLSGDDFVPVNCKFSVDYYPDKDKGGSRSLEFTGAIRGVDGDGWNHTTTWAEGDSYVPNPLNICFGSRLIGYDTQEQAHEGPDGSTWIDPRVAVTVTTDENGAPTIQN